MDINRNNYEAFLLDLMEGNLSPEDQQRLMEFLRMNPDCALPSENFDSWVLEKESLTFSAKEDLKKELPRSETLLSDANFDLFSIARLEGDLTPEQVKSHEAALENNQQKRDEWQEWQQTKLQASQLEYEGKEQLKKRRGPKGRIVWISMISAAATVALVVALLRMEPDLTETNFSETNQIEQTPGQLPSFEESPVSDTPDESAPLPEPQEEKILATVDEPLLFSIKKNPERPVETVEKGQAQDKGQVQDSLQQQEPRKIDSGPVRLASYEAYNSDLVGKSTYDQIKPLELPPTDIHLTSLSLAQISDIDLQEALDAYTEEKDISLWTVANAGIKGINRLTGSDISLVASRDEEGEVSGFRLKSKRFSFSGPIGDQSEEFSE
jgi:hypothetical protein